MNDIRLEMLCDINPETVSPVDSTDFKFRYLDISAVSQGVIDWNLTRLVSFDNAPSRARRVLREGDALLCTVRPGLQAHARISVTPTEPLVASTGFAVLRPRERTDSSFIFHQLFSDSVSHQLRAMETGSNYPAVNERDVRALKLFAPPSEERARIAAVLDAADYEIARTQAVIDKFKQIRTGLLHDLLTRGLDDNGELRDPVTHPEQFKDSPIGSISKSWDALPLERVGSVDRGKFGHRPRNDPALYGGGFPFIQTGDIASAAGEIIAKASQSLSLQGVAVSRQFPEGTIAITIAANIGDTAILGRPMFFPDSVVGVVPLHSHSSRWIEMCLRQAKARLNALAPQSAQKNINLTFLKPLIIPVPDPSEQLRCSELYESISSQILIQSDELKKLIAIKSGLMSDLLTGRVPPDLLDAGS